MNEPDCSVIPLSKGYSAIVSAEDVEALAGIKWHANIKGNGYVYAYGRVNGRHVGMHRFLMGCSKFVVDHVNGNTLDNRRSNLRLVDCATNNKNRHRPSRAQSGFLGVTVHGKFSDRFRARIRVFGEMTDLGVFASAEEAAEVVQQTIRNEIEVRAGLVRTAVEAAARMRAAGLKVSP